MNGPLERQQILVSGVGGQGILYITRLLAEAAIHKGYPVLTAETHGMAQRGGVVVSHLKVGGFTSPLIRPARADILLLLKKENLPGHFFYLSPGGIAVVNTPSGPETENGHVLCMDADKAAMDEIHRSGSVNLILTGFALSALAGAGRQVFCSPDDVRSVLRNKLSGRDKLLKASMSAFDLGVAHGEKVHI